MTERAGGRTPGQRIGLGAAFALAGLLASFMTALPATALRPGAIDLGLFGGYDRFSADTELGDPAVITTPTETLLMGVRVAYGVIGGLAVEVEGKLAPAGVRTSDDESGNKVGTFSVNGDATVFGVRGLVRWDFLEAGPVQPFIVGGGGIEVLHLDPDRPYAGLQNDNDTNFQAGIGACLAIGKTWGLRFDARYLAVPGQEPKGRESEQLLAHELELHLGAWFRLRGIAPDGDSDGVPDETDRCPKVAEDRDGYRDSDGCPDPDNDDDGVPDSADKCRNEPETRNGVEDGDGCPDFDTDGDGIADGRDACTNEPEDKDGFQDEDGCADHDDDKDGVADADDRCPKAAEDRDGVQDADGCPDLDDDADGVADDADKCPTSKETPNSFDDGDGCPDVVPPKVAQVFRGLVPEPAFAIGAAVLLPKAVSILEQAAALMQQHPTLRATVVAHPDDATGNEASRALAQARADTVKAWFVAKGTAADRVETLPGPVATIGATVKAQAGLRRFELRLR